jgi:pimeloyl-ACP methyl ester carboxylesterase
MDIDDADSVRHLVTLGAPYYAGRLSSRELAIFGTDDPLVVPPEPRYGAHGRIKILRDCGHLALLYHPGAIREVVAHLTRRPDTTSCRERRAPVGSELTQADAA